MTLQYRRVAWKYVLEKDVRITLPFEIWKDGTQAFASPHLGLGGSLFVIKEGYAWDGASGPTVDTETTMYAALVHDALYQLIRLGILPPEARKEVDKLFRRLLKADGMTFFRRGYFYWAVRWFGASSARPE